MNPETQLPILTNKLSLPSVPKLQPWLAKLINDPDSVVIIAIEKPFRLSGPHVGTAWLSAKERLIVRKALSRINTARAKNGQQPTTEMPQ